MAYCEVADLTLAVPEDRLVELTAGTASGSVDADVAGWAIDSAAAEIDGALGEIYSVPVAGTPTILKSLNVDLAICNLYARNNTKIPETWKEKCKKAGKMLEDLAEGKLVIRPLPSEPTSSRKSAVSTTRDKEFTATELGKF